MNDRPRDPRPTDVDRADPELVDPESTGPASTDPELIDAELLEAELIEGGMADQAVAEEPVGAGRSLLAASAAPAIGTALSRVTGLLRVADLRSLDAPHRPELFFEEHRPVDGDAPDRVGAGCWWT